MKMKGETVIDLEALANHKGSAFGGIGQGAQPSPEMFENRLALELMKAVADDRCKMSDGGKEDSCKMMDDRSRKDDRCNMSDNRI